MASREHIEAIGRKLEKLPSSADEDARISLTFQSVEIEGPSARANGRQRANLAELCVRSDKSKNALAGAMISQLTERLDELEAWARQVDSGCLLIYGHNQTFCSGSDLKTARATLDPASARELAQIMQYNFKRLAELPVLSVAFVSGYALGGGAELALAADLRIMAESAKLGFVHAKNGICCGWGGGLKLTRLVGYANALELLASGRLVGRAEAEQLGLACRWPLASGGQDEQDDRAMSLARQFCAAHAIKWPSVGGAVKSLVRAACELPGERALEVECQLFASTWGRPAHLEALERNMKHNQ